MQTFKEALEKTYTFNNLFLGQLDVKCEKIQTEINNLYKEAKDYGMGHDETLHISEQSEMMNDFRYMLRNEDIENCSDPDHADTDPGDFIPSTTDGDNAEDILEKLFHGHRLGYLNIPESLLIRIQALLSHRKN